MTHISANQRVTTLINVFSVEPEKQQALVELLIRATDETIRHLPGFISANIHRSLDGARVVNYAQWRSLDDFEAMLRNPAAQPHLKEAAALATGFEPHLYEVAEVRTVARRPTPVAWGAAAAGAIAIGACAIGALAIGRLAIGALAVRRARVHEFAIDSLTIGRLTIQEPASP